MTDLPHPFLTKAPALVLGIGCERGTDVEEVLALTEAALDEYGLAGARPVLVASLDSRRDEPAICAIVNRYGVPFQCFDAATLEAETPRLENPSEVVFRHTGCHGVAEAAALAGAGKGGRLAVAKRKSARATVAIAESVQGDGCDISELDSHPAAPVLSAGSACGAAG